MDWIMGIQRAIDYIESHLDEDLDYEEIARKSYSSSYHFQRIFSILCGYTLGTYIRNRRLTLAGEALANGKSKVIDIALQYGYESPDSFAKAFQKFHGITPSMAREEGAKLRSFTRLSIKITLEGGSTMNYRMEEKPAMVLTGIKRRFSGVPFGEEREKQEEQMFMSTRAAQMLLLGMTNENMTHYCAVSNIDDEGYDFWIAAPIDAYYTENLNHADVMGIDGCGTLFGFERMEIPAATYAIFETEKSVCAVPEYHDIRRRIVSEWLPGSGYQLADTPEFSKFHLTYRPHRNERYNEIWIPVKKAD